MSAKAQVMPVTFALGALPAARHLLDHEAEKMALLCRRLGRRMNYQLLHLPKGELPDREFRETMKVYQTGVFGLLAEQRTRAALGGSPKPVMTPEEEREEMESIALAVLRDASPEDRRRLLEACAIEVGEPAPAQHVAVEVLTEDELVGPDFDYEEKP